MSTEVHPSAPPVLLTALDDEAVLLIEGEDAVGFLQGQTTCDVANLADGDITLGAICNAKGRTVAVFRLFRAANSCFLVLRNDMLETVRRRLKPYVLRSSVRIADVEQNGNWQLSGLLGTLDRSATAILGVAAAPPRGHAARTAAGAWLLGIDRDAKYLLAASPEVTATVRTAFLADRAGATAPADVWYAAEIADGIPCVTPATTEEFLPQMLNLDLLRGISFKKGCYTGQEVVARTHYLGRVKRRMHRFEVSCGHPPASGDRLVHAADGSPVGQVLLAARTPDDAGRYDLLAVLTSEDLQADDLRLWSLTGPRVKPVSLPYTEPRS